MFRILLLALICSLGIQAIAQSSTHYSSSQNHLGSGGYGVSTNSHSSGEIDWGKGQELTSTSYINKPTVLSLVNKQVLSVPSIFDNTLLVYPNPFSSHLTIQFSGDISGITLYGASGTEVYQSTTWLGEENFSYLPPGLYLLQIKTSQGILVKRLVKL